MPMTVQIVCLMIAAVLPYAMAGASVPFRNRQFGKVDIAHPRVQGEKLVDAGARAWGAQSNAWEALIVFGLANLTAMVAGADPSGMWSIAAPLWVVARIGHGVFYIRGQARLRVACFVVGIVMSLWIFSLALVAA